jgi:hypothetical protein
MEEEEEMRKCAVLADICYSDSPGAHLTSFIMCSESSFSSSKVAEVDHPSPSRAAVRYVWNYISIFLNVCMELCLIKQGTSLLYNFTVCTLLIAIK